MNKEHTLGAYLKKEREFRQVTLNQLSKSTRIHQKYLHQIEEDRFESLPGPVFATGFLRAYTKQLGLDEAEVLARLQQLSVFPKDRDQNFRKFENLDEVTNKKWWVLAGAVLFVLFLVFFVFN